MTVILCLTCPMCHEAPGLVFSPEFAVCVDPDCPAFSWNMTKTEEDNLLSVGFIDLRGTQEQP